MDGLSSEDLFKKIFFVLNEHKSRIKELETLKMKKNENVHIGLNLEQI